MLNRLLDTLASRVGIVCIVGFLLSLCGGVGLYLQSVIVQLEEDHEVFRDAQIRNGYVAMSDVNRLVVAAQSALQAGEISTDLKREFAVANDMLFVRIDNFKNVMRRSGGFSHGPESIEALQRIVDIGDSAVRDGFPDLEVLVQNLLDGNDTARRNLVKFLDSVRRQGDLVLEQQSYAVRRQQFVVLVSLVGITFVGSVALLFLRREVLGRHAREAAEKRAAFMAYFDPLTELPNRVQFQDRLQSELSSGQPITLLYADLDDFKLINDTYGHGVGDAVLKHVGSILDQHTKRHDGFAARLAGDEFAVVVPNDDQDALLALCETLIGRVTEPLPVNGETIVIGISIGLATSSQVTQRMSLNVDTLNRVTDFALYAAKGEGRNQFMVYDHNLEAKFLERRSMIEELPMAILNKSLEVHLQPKVELTRRNVYGFEALVRWRRNGRIVSPNDFILIAEESGLIVDIDIFVLNAASEVVAEWNTEYGTDYSVSVNLSTLHLNSARIVELVQDALWQSNLPPNLLTLEITESTEIRDWGQANSTIDALRRVGCQISLDDFGTGFSSLAYLRSTKADELKIDKSLVDELECSLQARQLLSSVFDIAKNLDFKVVVEGIETGDQCIILQSMGAEFGQGYLFGRPLPALEALHAADEFAPNTLQQGAS